MDKIHLVVTAKIEFEYRGKSKKIKPVRFSIKGILVKGHFKTYLNVEVCWLELHWDCNQASRYGEKSLNTAENHLLGGVFRGLGPRFWCKTEWCWWDIPKSFTEWENVDSDPGGCNAVTSCGRKWVWGELRIKTPGKFWQFPFNRI